MTDQDLLKKIFGDGEINFADVIAYIDAHYHYLPTAFANGSGPDRLLNEAGTNEGSCKIFAFAKDQGLDEKQTLTLFGEHYRHVLNHPDGSDHSNIRRFMVDGWQGIEFFGQPLSPKS